MLPNLTQWKVGTEQALCCLIKKSQVTMCQLFFISPFDLFFFLHQNVSHQNNRFEKREKNEARKENALYVGTIFNIQITANFFQCDTGSYN
jgi:hypothetical protein